MDLTSYERLRRYLVGQGETSALTTNEAARRDLIRWIAPVSVMIESYLSRSIETTSYTEYHDLVYGQTVFFCQALPVTTLTSVYFDSSGEWDGGESELTDCFIGVDSRSICLPPRSSLSWEGPKAIRLIYVGGMGAHGTQSTFATTGSTGTWTVGKYVYGSTSGALGIVRASATGSLTVEVLYGVFSTGETLTEQDSESAVGTSDGSAALSAKTATAVCEGYPEITLAAEMQIRFMLSNKHNFENSGIQRDGVTSRSALTTTGQYPLSLQPEVMSVLDKHRRIIL